VTDQPPPVGVGESGYTFSHEHGDRFSDACVQCLRAELQAAQERGDKLSKLIVEQEADYREREKALRSILHDEGYSESDIDHFVQKVVVELEALAAQRTEEAGETHTGIHPSQQTLGTSSGVLGRDRTPKEEK